MCEWCVRRDAVMGVLKCGDGSFLSFSYLSLFSTFLVWTYLSLLSFLSLPLLHFLFFNNLHFSFLSLSYIFSTCLFLASVKHHQAPRLLRNNFTNLTSCGRRIIWWTWSVSFCGRRSIWFRGRAVLGELRISVFMADVVDTPASNTAPCSTTLRFYTLRFLTTSTIPYYSILYFAMSFAYRKFLN